MELGIYTFAEVMRDPKSGLDITPELRLSNLMEEIALADEVGLDVFALGEHHRPDYAISAPAVVLAAAATLTKRIRLSSAVTVLSSEDPVRVFQQFATLDLLSHGRAEIMAGRGSFIESFPLFGYDLADYDGLFTEKLDLLLKLRESEMITWKGRHRPSLAHLGVYPRPVQDLLPIWIAVGGTPESLVRAGQLGLPLALAIIGGYPERFRPHVELYRESAERAGHDPSKLGVSINSHGFIADTKADAAEIAYPGYAAAMNRIGRERGWPPLQRGDYEASADLRGHLFLGSPDEIVEKILYQHELFGHTRFMLQLSVGAIEHSKMLRAIELYGTVVAPQVRAALKS